MPKLSLLTATVLATLWAAPAFAGSPLPNTIRAEVAQETGPQRAWRMLRMAQTIDGQCQFLTQSEAGLLADKAGMLRKIVARLFGETWLDSHDGPLTRITAQSTHCDDKEHGFVTAMIDAVRQ